MKPFNALVLAASPRKKSISKKAAGYILNYLKKIGVEMRLVNTAALKISPCGGCEKCAKDFKCIKKDGVAALIKKVEDADVVIAASPVYFTGVPSGFKAFIDRNQVQWYRRLKKKRRKNIPGIIILTAGGRKKSYFMPAEMEIKSFFAVNGIKCVKVFRFKNMDFEKGLRPGEMKKICSGFAVRLLRNIKKNRGGVGA